MIVTMLARYLPPTPHFSVNAHFIHGVGDYRCRCRRDARHGALDHVAGIAGYVAGGAELVSARLEVNFVPAADTKRWLIRHFRTQRLFDAPWQVHPSSTGSFGALRQ